jgi:hypothetical protein
MSGYGRATSSTATACHHRDDDCANARTKRKARNREHLRAFSFYFRTFKYCNLTPPFVNYKRGGRDLQREGRKKKATPRDGNVLSTHSNTCTHRDLGSIPLSTSLHPPYYKHFGAKQQRALKVGTFSPNQYTSCACLAHHRRLRRATSFTCPISRHPRSRTPTLSPWLLMHTTKQLDLVFHILDELNKI